MYGMLMLAYDRCAVSPLDFTTRLNALRDTIDPSVLSAEQVSALNAALDEAESAAQAAWTRVSDVNAAYLTALDAGETEQAEKLLAESRALNDAVLKAFRFAEDSFVRLTWEDVSIFPHENGQNNILALDGAIAALEAGDAALALDEYLYLVDNNWYAYDWSRETFDHFTDYVLHQPAERLMWGAGRVQGHIDLFDVIRSLQTKRESGGDCSAELEILRAARAQATADLEGHVEQELRDLQSLTGQLTALMQ